MKPSDKTTTLYDDGCLRRVVIFDANETQTYYVTNEDAEMSDTTDCPIHRKGISLENLREHYERYNKDRSKIFG